MDLQNWINFLLMISLTFIAFKSISVYKKFIGQYNKNTKVLEDRIIYLEDKEKAQHEAIIYWTKEMENLEREIKELK